LPRAPEFNGDLMVLRNGIWRPSAADLLVNRDSGTEKPRHAISLSEWVNEKLPAWDQVLSSRDVARLTRRRPWLIRTLTLLGRFPKQQRFHNRAIGWAKGDVLRWLSDEASLVRRRAGMGRLSLDSATWLQVSLPMHLTRTRCGRGPCSLRRKGRDRS